MARSLPVENQLPQNVGSIINYLQFFAEVAQWGELHGGSTPWAPRIAQFNAGCKSQDLLHWLRCERATFGTLGQRTACVATQGMFIMFI